MAIMLLTLLVWSSVWCVCDSNRIRRLENRVSRIEGNAIFPNDLDDIEARIAEVNSTLENHLNSDCGNVVEEVKATVEGLKAYVDESNQRMKEDILKALCDTVNGRGGCQAVKTICTTQEPETTEVTHEQTTSTTTSPQRQVLSCLELYNTGERQSGAYTIHIQGLPVLVYCDMDTDGGGWTVFQRRKDGSEDFYRTWDEYAAGFGDVDGEFWLGNDVISAMTCDCRATHELRVDIGDFNGNVAFAKYSTFQLLTSKDNFALVVNGFTGDAGDSLSRHSGMPFTTKDKDNDFYPYNLAHRHFGAWWYFFDGCYSHLNGLYGPNMASGHEDRAVYWMYWTRTVTPLKWTEMKFRARPQA